MFLTMKSKQFKSTASECHNFEITLPQREIVRLWTSAKENTLILENCSKNKQTKQTPLHYIRQFLLKTIL